MEKQWTAVIKPKKKLLDLNLKETFKYRDLIWLFVVRNIKTRYKQTVLGPLWFVIQPLMSSVIHTLVFGTIAGLSTDGVPQFLFYLIGSVTWALFSGCLTGNSNTFVGNAHVFGKVYFPRLTSPISTAITQMFNFVIQFAIYLVMSLIFFLKGEVFQITWVAALLPLLVIQLSLLGTGLGIIISSLTTKYRDLQVLVGFGVQLFMYVSPVVYSANELLGRKLYIAFMLNPVSPVIELFRYGWLGAGSTPWMYWGISWVTTVVIFLLGVVMFNRVEKNFMDTV
ncbi:MAG: ABC transporter permease [Clostridia bacterium]|nr:ABC transporter permease [Clostridia bacterium]